MSDKTSHELVLLLPPSEGKAPGGSGRWSPNSGTFGRRLGPARSAVVDALGRTDLGSRQLGVEGDLLVRALAATGHLVKGRGKALPAHERFTGVVWEHLDPATLDDEARRRVLVPSALLGLVASSDPVPDHRCKFTVRLPDIGRLDNFWRAPVTEALRARRPAAVYVDLLPNEHRAAIDFDHLDASRVHHVVRSSFAGATGHDAKAVKGALARFLLQDGLDAADRFTWQGWRASYDVAAAHLAVVLS